MAAVSSASIIFVRNKVPSDSNAHSFVVSYVICLHGNIGTMSDALIPGAVSGRIDQILRIFC